LTYLTNMLQFLTNILQFLNTKLVVPMQLLQNFMSIKTESLPDFIQTPVNFISALMFLFFIIIGYANDFICNIIGILYPLMYSFNLFNGVSLDITKSALLFKY